MKWMLIVYVFHTYNDLSFERFESEQACERAAKALEEISDEMDAGKGERLFSKPKLIYHRCINTGDENGK